MKVLHTLDSLNRGGAESLALSVCRNAKKHDVDLSFAAFDGGELESEFKNSGASFIRLQRRFPFDPILVRRLRRIIREREIEFVQGYQPVEAMHLYFATRGLQRVFCLMSHQGGGLVMSRGKNRFAARMFSPVMDANIACSAGMVPWLRDELGIDTDKNFVVVNNGADPDLLLQGVGTLRDELGLRDGDHLLGMVANFIATDTKDQMTVCRSLPRVMEELENVHFVFAGGVAEDGEAYFESCKQICIEGGIEDRVTFLGKRTDIPNILHSLDLFVFSTLHEGLPLALCEALLAGVPAVVSDIEPNLEIVGQGKYARVFEKANPESLASAIIEALGDKKLSESYATQAREHAIQNFSIDAHWKNLKEVYEALRNGTFQADSFGIHENSK